MCRARLARNRESNWANEFLGRALSCNYTLTCLTILLPLNPAALLYLPTAILCYDAGVQTSMRRNAAQMAQKLQGDAVIVKLWPTSFIISNITIFICFPSFPTPTFNLWNSSWRGDIQLCRFFWFFFFCILAFQQYQSTLIFLKFFLSPFFFFLQLSCTNQHTPSLLPRSLPILVPLSPCPLSPQPGGVSGPVWEWLWGATAGIWQRPLFGEPPHAESHSAASALWGWEVSLSHTSPMASTKAITSPGAFL